MNIAGKNRVGLTVSICLSEAANDDVTCVGKVQEEVDQLSLGKLTFHEPELDDLLERNVKRRQARVHRRLGPRRVSGGNNLHYRASLPTRKISPTYPPWYRWRNRLERPWTNPRYRSTKYTVPARTADKIRENWPKILIKTFAPELR